MPPPRPTSRFARALTGALDAPVALGLTFAPAVVLETLGGSPEAVTALPVAAESLRLDFAFVEAADAAAYGPLTERACEPVAIVNGPFGRTLDCIGWKDGLLATVEDPESLRRLLTEAEEEASAAIHAAAEAGAGAIVVAEDLAGSAGPLVAPDYAFAEIFPHLQSLTEAAAARGLPTLLHTDGDARAFALSAARAGFAGIHGGGGLDEPRHNALVAAVRAARLSFLGGILTTELDAGPMTAIASGSRAAIRARGGGILLCDDGGLSTAAQASALLGALAAARDEAEAFGGGG